MEGKEGKLTVGAQRGRFCRLGGRREMPEAKEALAASRETRLPERGEIAPRKVPEGGGEEVCPDGTHRSTGAERGRGKWPEGGNSVSWAPDKGGNSGGEEARHF